MFADVGAMKDKLRKQMTKEEYKVTNFYNKNGIWQSIARNPFFENFTLSVIVLNAAWIAVDTELNDAEMLIEAPPVFQVVENAFCLYFTVEIMVRFGAFASKRDCLKDGWFAFDSMLVTFMVLETWVFSLVLLLSGISSSSGNASILRVGRLMRLTRMARMARLLRAMPELLILIKGMLAAARSVLCTLCLLLFLMYSFGIAFKQLSSGTESGRIYFDTLPNAMHCLLLNGTLLDNLTDITTALRRDASDGSLHLLGLFYLYVLLSSLILMNMLIGVLCEVVSAVSLTEREQNMITEVKDKLRQIMLLGVDGDQDGKISEEEFCSMLENEEAAKCLQEVGVDVVGLVDVAEFIFEDVPEDDPQLSFAKFVEVILDLRGSNTATVKDIVDLRKFVMATVAALEDAIHDTVSEVTDAVCRSGGQPTTKGSDAGARGQLPMDSMMHVTSVRSERNSVTSIPSEMPPKRNNNLRPTLCLSTAATPRRASAMPASARARQSTLGQATLSRRKTRLGLSSAAPPVDPKPLLAHADSAELLGGQAAVGGKKGVRRSLSSPQLFGDHQAKILQLTLPDLALIEDDPSNEDDEDESSSYGVSEKTVAGQDQVPPKPPLDSAAALPLGHPAVPADGLPNGGLAPPDGLPPLLPGFIGIQSASSGQT